jgi:ATP-dependent RNA helicase DeaD
LSKFSELGVSAPLVRSLEELGFENPTTIQEKALPILSKANVDFIGLAHTGTGKTAAFGLPLLDTIQTNVPAIQALILAPTRELGQQIAAHLREYGKYVSQLNVQVVYGGQPIQRQIKDLRRVPQILVATPGRLIDLLGRKALKLNLVRYLVLDEADEMLNMGFKESIDKILSKTPADKYTWLFSATMSREIRSIVEDYMNDPKEVKIEAGAVINQNIKHHYIVTKRNDKLEILKNMIDSIPDLSGVIFCRTKLDTRDLADELLDAGYPIDAIHGDLTQKQRDWVMKRFKEGKIKLITATDVVARGIDVKDLTHVIHYQLPDDLDYYTHRSGRTARAGKEGASIAFISRGEEKKIRELERTLKINIQKLDEGLNVVEETAEEKRRSASTSSRSEFGRDRSRKNDRERRGDGERRNDGGRRGDRDRRSERTGRPDRGFSNSREKEKAVEGSFFNRIEKASKDKKLTPRNRIAEPGRQRFFINIGKVDDVSKNELMQFLCDQTRLTTNHVQKIEMFDRHSFFEVNHDAAAKIPKFFKGIEIDGRELRVNEG